MIRAVDFRIGFSPRSSGRKPWNLKIVEEG